MVLKRRLEYGFNGYRGPVIPRAPRSIRKRGPRKKTVEDSQLCAFELLAAVAGKLLLENESSASSNVAEVKSQPGSSRGRNEKVQPKDDKALKSESFDHGSCAESAFVPKISVEEGNLLFNCNGIPQAENDQVVEQTAVRASSDFQQKLHCDIKLGSSEDKSLDENGPCKIESSNCIGESLNSKVESGSEVQSQDDKNQIGHLSMANTSTVNDPIGEYVNTYILSNPESSVKFPLYRDSKPDALLKNSYNNVKLGSRDDDENSFRCKKSSTKGSREFGFFLISMASRLAHSGFLILGPHKRPNEGNRIFPQSSTSSGSYLLKWESLPQRSIKQKQCLKSLQKRQVVKAVAVNVAPSPSADSAEYRQQLCHEYGFRQIGEPLPDNITLRDIIDTLPKKVFEIDDAKALKSVLVSVTSYALGIFMITKSPWYLLPLAWAWTGTAITGFFVIGHDCAHKSFSKNKLVEDIVGTLAFMPLIYPYEPWRFKHDRHHAKTNMLEEDTAWLPVNPEEFESSSLFRKAIIYAYGPLRPWMSIAHWLRMHFDVKKFRPNEVKRVKISLACVFGFMAIGWPLIILKTGVMGWIKFWLMPWLGYHFWMSTFTMVHHTAPHIPFKPSEEWNAAQAQLNGTVHCDYPSWIEILCHDINVHIPHHISPRIPSYNLRAAHQSLQENWGKYLNEASWNWRLMKTILTVCHVYSKEKNYIPFDELAPDDSQPITFLKQVMPDYA